MYWQRKRHCVPAKLCTKCVSSLPRVEFPVKTFNMHPIPSNILTRQQDGVPGETSFDGIQERLRLARLSR
jgi:hypothetical protein